MTKNQIKTVKIKNIREECEGVKTITFNVKNILDNDTKPMPGQFLMVWVPGVDEIPMSLSAADWNGNWSITVKNVGECSNALCNLSIGDYIGVRGPLGNSFTIPKENLESIFLIGGGTGIAPLRYLAIELHRKKLQFTFIEGAKEKEEIISINQFDALRSISPNILYCTDDGSLGSEGFASNIFKKEIQKYSQKELSNGRAYTCGPEIMMKEVFNICEKYDITMEASLERMMRCGCGLCGLCALDPLGLLVCEDGPIFDSETLRKVDDFGKYKRDITGKKLEI